jgi:hypothetical protein
MNADLAKIMVARADADKLPPDHDLRIKAAAFDEAVAGFYGTPQTYDVKRFMGHWARARKCWCDYSGEALI